MFTDPSSGQTRQTQDQQRRFQQMNESGPHAGGGAFAGLGAGPARGSTGC